MTEQEMRFHHYMMWNRITDAILNSENVVNIVKMKEEYIKVSHCDLNTFNNCFMCEYAMANTSIEEITTCSNCPSTLQFIHFRGCLSGLYYICISTSEWKTQAVISSLIRDSWE